MLLESTSEYSVRLLIAGFLCSVLAGCGGGSDSSPAEEKVPPDDTEQPINTPPTATIISPAPGTTIVEGTNIKFLGTASDKEDGNLNADLTWSSSVDGSLENTGGDVDSTLSVGSHKSLTLPSLSLRRETPMLVYSYEWSTRRGSREPSKFRWSRCRSSHVTTKTTTGRRRKRY